MRDWTLTDECDMWTVKLDALDLGGHLNITFRGWSATLASRVWLVKSRLVLLFVLPLDFHGRLWVLRSMFILGALAVLRLLDGPAGLWSYVLCGLVPVSHDSEVPCLPSF